MPRPFLSVVVDNHNYARYLGAALDSVLAQDLPPKDFEILVVDDGSTDDSRNLLKRYAPRVRAVLQDQSGQATAITRGFSEARGEVVCLLDSDDVWKPEKLSKIAALFDDPGVGAVQHYLQDADAALKPLREGFPAWPARYRKSAVAGALPIPKDLFYYLDDYLTVRALLKHELANVPEVLGLHRVHGGNWCAGGYEDPRKLEVDFRMRGIYGEALSRWLAEAGKSPTPRFREVESLELLRRRVLYEALKARPAEAWRLWLEGALALRAVPDSAFRLATLLLAVASPTLYLSLYSAYAASPRGKA